MAADFPQIGPYLLVALIIFAVYRRLRRSFGRQPLRPGRMVFRIVLLCVIGVLLSPTALRSSAFGAAALGGLASGVLLGLWGASGTRFERIGEEQYYVPHTYIGVAVSLLFIGRVAYPLLRAYEVTHGARAGPSTEAAIAGGYLTSPLTIGLFYVLVGYYVCWATFVLWKSKDLTAGDAEKIPAALGRGDSR